MLDRYSKRPGSRRAIGALLVGYRYLGRYHEQCVSDVRRALDPAGLKAATRWGNQRGIERALDYAIEAEPGPKAV